MDAETLTAPPPAPNWRLDLRVAAQTQGIVVVGFNALQTGRALLLEFKWPGDSGPVGWLNRLLSVAPITSAIPPVDTKSRARAASISFSGVGLRRMGLPEEALASFGRPFQEGMFREDRLRRLGDRREGQWLDTVLEGGPIWSANTPSELRSPNAPDGPIPDTSQSQIETAVTVHALLLLYAMDEAAADVWANEVAAQLAPDNVEVVRRLELMLDVQKGSDFSREHFGFADGLSQPLPYDENGAVRVGSEPAVKDPVQGVPLGEFVFGYFNGHHEKAPGPVVADGDAARAAGLLASEKAEGFCDLGLNGSYLVVRELKQEVAAFWRSMEASAAVIRGRDPEHSQHVTAQWLAEQVVGRDRDGQLLCPGNVRLPACDDGSTDSSFLFHERDPLATGCPAGSHVRRAFPRDALAPKPADRLTLLEAANNHRILRRGRKFGTKLEDTSADDGRHRGLLFMCLNTDIERQFEFVQQTWLLNSSFSTLFQEVDPLVGPAGRMTIRDEPLRRTVNVETFVRMAGGDYFFLPSLPALQFLGSL